MPIGINDLGEMVVEFDHDIAFSAIQAEDGGVILALDTDWVTAQRHFEPKVVLWFMKSDEIDWLIRGLKGAKKQFKKLPKHIPESDNIPSGK